MIEPFFLKDEHYRELLHHLTDYIYSVKVYEGLSVETAHGPGCLAVTGYTSEDYIKDPELWHRMVHKDDHDAVTHQAKEALAGRDVAPLEHRIRHRNGSIRWVTNTIVLSRNEQGFLTAYYGLIKDITALKKSREQADKKQELLIQADKMASLGVLIAGIAHEINNPNNFIILNINLFRKIWEDIQPILAEYYENNGDFAMAGMPYSSSIDKTNSLLTGISNGSKRIKTIVSSLREYSRKDGGKTDQPVNIKAVIDHALLITENLIKNSTNKLILKLDKNVPIFRGNPQQLEQVIINLLTNACQSLDNKDKSIRIKARFKKSENKIKIEIKDEGAGIEEENLNQIFDPFFTTRRDDGGSGLGLSISYNIIKSHGGKLKIDSKCGSGTRAVIILPFFAHSKK